MKNFFVFITLTYFISACSPFSKLAKESKVETVNGYVRVFNPKVNLSNLNFGDVRFAFTKKEYKLLNPKTKPSFKNILLYGKTITAPFYNYYILQETNDLSDILYSYFDFGMDEDKVILAISKNTPTADKQFIIANISDYLK
ncbi:MAG: hypothetical protein QNL60_07990 [Flavobacteriales bacterium]